MLYEVITRRDFTLNRLDSIMYDGTLSQVEALVNADAADVYGASFSFEFLFTNSLRTHHDITFTNGNRITSYNVCYTKLLRSSLSWC